MELPGQQIPAGISAFNGSHSSTAQKEQLILVFSGQTQRSAATMDELLRHNLKFKEEKKALKPSRDSGPTNAEEGRGRFSFEMRCEGRFG